MVSPTLVAGPSGFPVWFAGRDGLEDCPNIKLGPLSRTPELVDPPAYDGPLEYVPPSVISK